MRSSCRTTLLGERVKMNYLEIRKKYAFYRKVVIVLAVLLILFVAWMVKDTSIFSKLPIISGLFKVDVVWNANIKYIKERNINIYSDVDDEGSDNLLVELRY